MLNKKEMLSEYDFLANIKDKYENRSKKSMQSLEDIKEIFKIIDKRIKDLGVKENATTKNK